MDTNNDGKADMQFVIEYPKERTGEVWPNGHYMIMFDLDRDNIFNYINWNNFTSSVLGGVEDCLISMKIIVGRHHF